MKIRKHLMMLLVLTLLFSLNYSSVFAEYNGYIRIGLYYGSSALDTVTISSAQGTAVGFTNNGAMTVFFNEPVSKVLTVRKDWDYHVKIGGDYGSYANALTSANWVTSNGFNAYPVYTGNGWELWEGYYSDINAMKASLVSLKTKLPNDTYGEVNMDNSRVVVVASDQVDFRVIFGLSGSYLRIKPLGDIWSNAIKVNTKRYRGEIEIRTQNGSDLSVINEDFDGISTFTV